MNTNNATLFKLSCHTLPPPPNEGKNRLSESEAKTSHKMLAFLS